MGDHAQHAVARTHGLFGGLDDGVACLDRNIGVDVDMHIHHQHVAHLARAQIMAPPHPGVVIMVVRIASTSSSLAD